MSFNPKNPLEYRKGFKNPKGGKPAFRRTSFNKATNPANAGDEAEVPPMRVVFPPMKTLNLSPCAATSG